MKISTVFYSNGSFQTFIKSAKHCNTERATFSFAACRHVTCIMKNLHNLVKQFKAKLQINFINHSSVLRMDWLEPNMHNTLR